MIGDAQYAFHKAGVTEAEKIEDCIFPGRLPLKLM